MSKVTPGVIGASVTVVVGFILLTVGVFSPEWTPQHGLFQSCGLGSCQSIHLDETPEYFKATVALEIIAFLASLTCLVGVAIFVVLRLLSKAEGAARYMPIVALLGSIFAGVFAIIGCVVFIAETIKLTNGHAEVGYSFILAIVGAIIILVGGILFFVKSKSSQIGGV